MTADWREARAMPIYMDRHELTGTTAEEGAQAHLKDLAIQDRYGVKFLTYWCDEARGTIFCLVQSPDKEDGQPRPSRGARRRHRHHGRGRALGGRGVPRPRDGPGTTRAGPAGRD